LLKKEFPMKKRVISIALVVGLLIGAGVLTRAMAGDWDRGGHGMHGKHRGHGMMRMLRALDLSDEQQEQVRSALVDARKTGIVSRAQLRVARMELHEALLQDSIDATAIEQLKEQIKTLQGALLDNRVKAQQAISSVLTPEQRQEARGMVLEWMSERPEGKFHHRRGHHGRGHGRFHGGDDHERGHDRSDKDNDDSPLGPRDRN
jgi:Spy/CpxP family protein refolding chaperone